MQWFRLLEYIISLQTNFFACVQKYANIVTNHIMIKSDFAHGCIKEAVGALNPTKAKTSSSIFQGNSFHFVLFGGMYTLLQDLNYVTWDFHIVFNRKEEQKINYAGKIWNTCYGIPKAQWWRGCPGWWWPNLAADLLLNSLDAKQVRLWNGGVKRNVLKDWTFIKDVQRLLLWVN